MLRTCYGETGLMDFGLKHAIRQLLAAYIVRYHRLMVSYRIIVLGYYYTVSVFFYFYLNLV